MARGLSFLASEEISGFPSMVERTISEKIFIKL